MEPWIKQIFTNIIELEGGINNLTNVKNDRGGLTRAGLTARLVQKFFNLTSLSTMEEMSGLSEDKIYEIYHTYFWKNPQFDKLFAQRQRKAALILAGSAVNHGQATAIRLLQMACNEISRSYNEHGYTTKRPYLKVDGIIGPITIKVARNCVRFPKFCKIFLQHRQQYYNSIVINEVDNFLEHHPEFEDKLSQYKFLAGWTNRLVRLEDM